MKDKRIVPFYLKFLSLIIAMLLIGGLIGFIIGSRVVIKVVAQIAAGFIDPELVAIAITQYSNNLGRCFPSQFENASIYNIQGN